MEEQYSNINRKQKTFETCKDNTESIIQDIRTASMSVNSLIQNELVLNKSDLREEALTIEDNINRLEIRLQEYVKFLRSHRLDAISTFSKIQ
ncbi:gp24 [Sphingomonas phage PAU]|uniref:gp24 n=1 Tax=Sphingomonas phage PAU TaxID=1150991 RepID=UPI000257311D|nr:gp24 [Sphingomonas phage PAU]AFF28022.1 gp24 [Sphingomonas phage PAU]